MDGWFGCLFLNQNIEFSVYVRLRCGFVGNWCSSLNLKLRKLGINHKWPSSTSAGYCSSPLAKLKKAKTPAHRKRKPCQRITTSTKPRRTNPICTVILSGNVAWVSSAHLTYTRRSTPKQWSSRDQTSLGFLTAHNTQTDWHPANLAMSWESD